MKKNLLYLIIVLVLGALTYFFVFKEDSSPFNQDEANFTVKDSSKMTRIFLTDLKENKIKLERKENKWVLNDLYEPTQDMLKLLLEALLKQIPEQPVSSNYHDFAIKSLAGNNVKVEIYDKDEKTHVFYVAKDPTPNHLTYMLTEGAKRPFIVRLPFDDDFLGIRYVTSLDAWRNKLLFNDNSQLEYIEVLYKDSTHYNYKLTMNDGKASIIGKTIISGQINEKRVQSYLNLLQKVYCVGYENKNFEKESILQKGREMATVKLKRKQHEEEELIIYFRPIDKGSKGAITLDGVEYDIDYFYGLLNKKDFINIGIESIQKLIRQHNEFYELDSIPSAAN